MSTFLGRVGRMVPAAVAALVLGACSNSASPTAATGPVATAAGGQQPASAASSITVQGRVVDSSNRPMTAQVECMGGVQCVPFGAQVIADDGPDDGVKTNAAGAYLMVVRRTGGSDRFLMSATAKGYELTFHEAVFPDPTCTSDRAGCTVTVDFALAPQAD